MKGRERGESDSLKPTYVEGSSCKTNRDEQGGGGSKFGNLERRYILNIPT